MMAAMTSTAATDETIAALTAQVAALSARCEGVLSENAQLRAQVAWFQRQLFGRKSERRIMQPDAAQGTLGEAFDAVPDAPAPAKKTRVAGHERSTKPKRADADESTLFFDEGKVPVEVIAVANPEAAGLAPEDYEVIGERVSHRLAQRPGSYVVLKYVRPVIKRRDTQALSCPAAPVGVIEGSRADVSFIAGLLVDKLVYHLPLYRQHQRLAQCGIRVSRQWLTQIAQAAIALIEPVHDAQWQSVLISRVKRMDETPLKAGRAGPGKMKSAYFWPVMGEHEEICFHYQPSRRQEHVEQLLGPAAVAGGVLHTDGYSAYAWYAKKTGIAHAQCWAHSRRAFVKAEAIEPERVAQALEHIGVLYASRKRSAEESGWPRQARVAAAACVAGGTAVLRVGGQAVRGARLAAEQSAHEGAGLCARAPRRPDAVSARPGRRDRYEFIGARVARHPNGQEELDVLLDRTGCQADRHRAKPVGDVQAARHRSLRLLGRRAPARGPASGFACA